MYGPWIENDREGAAALLAILGTCAAPLVAIGLSLKAGLVTFFAGWALGAAFYFCGPD